MTEQVAALSRLASPTNPSDCLSLSGRQLTVCMSNLITCMSKRIASMSKPATRIDAGRFPWAAIHHLASGFSCGTMTTSSRLAGSLCAHPAAHLAHTPNWRIGCIRCSAKIFLKKMQAFNKVDTSLASKSPCLENRHSTRHRHRSRLPRFQALPARPFPETP